jgi:hypothetical protein
VVDTDDLSTIRGASWALLEFPEVFPGLFASPPERRVETVQAGGSTGLYRVTTDLDRDQLEIALSRFFLFREPLREDGMPEGLAAVIPHLKFTFGLASAEDYPSITDAWPVLHRDQAFRQYQSLDVDLPDVAGLTGDIGKVHSFLPCSKDLTRPRAAMIFRSMPDGGSPQQDVPVSASVKARHDFGRVGRRHEFYRRHAGFNPSEKLGYADSFEEIAMAGDGPPHEQGVEGRMALVSLDGNGFESLRQRFLDADPGHGLKAYADAMGASRKALLHDLLTMLSVRKEFRLRAPAKTRIDGESRQTPVLRLETLLWGADEALFVIPALGVPAFLSALNTSLLGSAGEVQVSDGSRERLTYGIGVLVCHYKTPIRMARRFVELLQDEAKLEWRKRKRETGAVENLFQMMILKGMEVPMGGVAIERERRYRIPGARQGQAFTIPLAAADVMFRAFRALKGRPGNGETGVARSQLADIVNTAVEGMFLGEPVANTAVAEQSDELRRLLAGSRKDERDVFPQDYFSQSFPWAETCPLAPLVPLLEFWRFLGNENPGADAA